MKDKYKECPNCHNIVEKRDKQCPYCLTNLKRRSYESIKNSVSKWNNLSMEGNEMDGKDKNIQPSCEDIQISTDSTLSYENNEDLKKIISWVSLILWIVIPSIVIFIIAYLFAAL